MKNGSQIPPDINKYVYKEGTKGCHYHYIIYIILYIIVIIRSTLTSGSGEDSANDEAKLKLK